MSNISLRKERTDFGKSVSTHLRSHAKGTGWKKSQDCLIWTDGELFFATDFRTHMDEHRTTVSFTGRPMAIDEVFWDVMEMPENREKPLSFRATGWFRCPVPKLQVSTFEDQSMQAGAVARKCLDFAAANMDTFRKDYSLRGFTDMLEDHPQQRDRGNYATTLFCLYCVAGETEKAAAFAADHVAGRRTAGATYASLDKDFFELALEYLKVPGTG